MRLSIVAVLTALCASGTLQAQSFPRTPPPVAAYSLLLLRNEATYKELNLDEAQKKKAAELGREANRRLSGVVTGRAKADDLTKEIEKDLAFLKPDQRKRLRELTWQRLA